MHKRRLFNGASAAVSFLVAVLVLAIVVRGWGDMRDLFRNRVLAADGGDSNIRRFACLGEGVVTTVEVLAFLMWSENMSKKQGAPWCITFNLFCNRSFLLGSLPYKRKRRASSGDSFCRK
jgi:hypothetical protein